MQIKINYASQFRDAFNAAGRGQQFSYDALGLLFDYFEEIEPDMELDVVAICCEYSEDAPLNIADIYNIELNSDDSVNDQLQQIKDFLESTTIMVGTTSTGAIVYASSF